MEFRDDRGPPVLSSYEPMGAHYLVMGFCIRRHVVAMYRHQLAGWGASGLQAESVQWDETVRVAGQGIAASAAVGQGFRVYHPGR